MGEEESVEREELLVSGDASELEIVNDLAK